jgi:hypothetical protein
VKVTESFRVIGDDGDGAVADVLELPAGQPAGPGRPFGILAVLGLDPGLLVDADDHGAWRRPQVHIAYRGGLGPELVVVAAVQPAPDPVRRQLQVRQDTPGLGRRDAGIGQLPGDQGVGPCRCSLGRDRGGGRHDRQPDLRPVDLGPAAAGPVAQGGHATAGEPAPPGPHRARRAAQPGSDLSVRPARVGQQHDPGAPHQRLRRGRPANDRLQFRLAARSQDHDVPAGCARHDMPFQTTCGDRPRMPGTRSEVAAARRPPRQ